MSDFDIVQSTLKETARRRRFERAWSGLWHGLLWGALLWLAALITYKLAPIPYMILSYAGLAALASAVVGAILGYSKSSTLQETARWIDRKQDLKERMSTALEVKGNNRNEDWRDLIVSDAARHAKEVNTRRLVTFSLPRATRWAALVLLLGAGLGFVPEYRTNKHLQREKDKAVIKEAGRQIAQITRRNLEQRPPALEPTRQSMEAAAQLGDQLSKASISRTDALKDLANVTDRLKKDLADLGKNPGVKPLEKAARENGRAGGASSEMQRQIDSLQKAIGDKAGQPDALDKLQKDLEKAKQVAAGMPGANSPEGAAARQQLAQTLSDLARQARDLGQPLPNLDEALEALKQGETGFMVQNLDAATKDLEKLRENMKTLAQLQEQVAKMGKDLAEQLQNGQAEAAQETLQKMMEQLKKANVSPADMAKLAEEVGKAIDPASKYGKAGEHLAEAGKKMKSGDKAGAAESLAAAGKELQNLMEQMEDAKSLAATLEALQKAQMCVGNGKAWGQMAGGAPRASQGGRAGRGVGTWAEESGWLNYPEITDRWDNTGIERPDMEGKGHSDRGDGQLADTIVPTKVRGQLQAGGPMPSITLKGVSIKGQSTEAYQDAAAAAQTEAQSALNQDQVPRAYQGAVRDYFDDLKK